MKTKRSVLSALLAGAMVFSLAGCTGAASTPGAAAATAAPTAEGVPPGAVGGIDGRHPARA